MRSIALITLPLIFALGCGRVDKVDVAVTASDASDLSNIKLAKADSALAKTERVVRKLRLAEVLLSKKFNLVSKFSTATNPLNSCVTDTEISSQSEWNWLCGSNGSSGKSYFSYNGAALQKIELEMTSKVDAKFGDAREVLSLSDISDTTSLSGIRTLSFKMNWDLYQNIISDRTRVCESNTSAVKINVETRNVLDKDGKVVKDANGDPVTEHYANSLTIDRLSMNCDQSLTASISDDTFVELKTSTLNISNANHVFQGALNFEFRDSKLSYTGAMTLDETGLTEPSEGKIRSWSCLGQPLCFP